MLAIFTLGVLKKTLRGISIKTSKPPEDMSNCFKTNALYALNAFVVSEDGIKNISLIRKLQHRFAMYFKNG
jgi:hypothetical protein